MLIGRIEVDERETPIRRELARMRARRGVVNSKEGGGGRQSVCNLCGQSSEQLTYR